MSAEPGHGAEFPAVRFGSLRGVKCVLYWDLSSSGQTRGSASLRSCVGRVGMVGGELAPTNCELSPALIPHCALTGEQETCEEMLRGHMPASY